MTTPNGMIPARQVEGLSAVLVPWTTVGSDGEPTLMWDDDDNLMMVEEPR